MIIGELVKIPMDVVRDYNMINQFSHRTKMS